MSCTLASLLSMKSSRTPCLRTWCLGTFVASLVFLQWLRPIEAQLNSFPPPDAQPVHQQQLDSPRLEPGGALRAWPPWPPNFHHCDRAYGTGLSADSCMRALSTLPINHQTDLHRNIRFLQNSPHGHVDYEYRLVPLRMTDPRGKRKPKGKR